MNKESLEKWGGRVLNFLGGAVLDKNPFFLAGGLALHAGGIALTFLSDGKKVDKKQLYESLAIDVASAGLGYGVKKIVKSKVLGKTVKEEREETAPLLRETHRQEQEGGGMMKKSTFLSKQQKQEEKLVHQQFQKAMGKVRKNPHITIHTGDPPYYDPSKQESGLNMIRLLGYASKTTFDETKAVVTDAWGVDGRVILKIKYEDEEFMFYRSTGLGKKIKVPADRFYATPGMAPRGIIVKFGNDKYMKENFHIPFFQDMGNWLNRLYAVKPPPL